MLPAGCGLMTNIEAEVARPATAPAGLRPPVPPHRQRPETSQQQVRTVRQRPETARGPPEPRQDALRQVIPPRAYAEIPEVKTPRGEITTLREQKARFEFLLDVASGNIGTQGEDDALQFRRWEVGMKGSLSARGRTKPKLVQPSRYMQALPRLKKSSAFMTPPAAVPVVQDEASQPAQAAKPPPRQPETAARPSSPPPIPARPASPQPTASPQSQPVPPSDDASDSLDGLWINFGPATLALDLPDDSEGQLLLGGKPIGEVLDAGRTLNFSDPERWLPATSVGAKPALPSADEVVDAYPRSGLAPRRVRVMVELQWKHIKVPVQLDLIAVRVVGLRFVLPSIAGPKLSRLPKTECCGTLLTPSKRGIRLRVDNAIFFHGAQQSYHPVCVNSLPGGQVELSYMGLKLLPYAKLSYDPGSVLLVLLLVGGSESTGEQAVPMLTESTVLLHAGGEHGNRHSLKSMRDGREIMYDLNPFNHSVQRFTSASEYHLEVRQHCAHTCSAIRQLTDPLTKRRLMNGQPSDFLLVEVEMELKPRLASEQEPWGSVRNVKDLAEKLMKSNDFDRICGCFDAQPIYLTSPESGSGKSWFCEQLQYFVAEPAVDWLDETVEGVALVPLLIHVNHLERELRWLNEQDRLEEVISSAHDLLPWYISITYGGERNEPRRRVLMQAFEMHALLVIVDGVDEAVDFGPLVLGLIFDVLRAYGHRLVVTARSDQIYSDLFHHFVKYNLCPLSVAQQKTAFTLQLGKNSGSMRFFENLMNFTQLRVGHDALYHELFGKNGFDMQVEQIPTPNRILIKGHPNPNARHMLRDKHVRKRPVGASARSLTLKLLSKQLNEKMGVEKIDAIDKMDAELHKMGEAATGADLDQGWVGRNFRDEGLRKLVSHLAVLHLNRRAAAWKEAEAARLAAEADVLGQALMMAMRPPPDSKILEAPAPPSSCRTLWQEIVARTDEIYIAYEDGFPLFKAAMNKLVETMSDGIELRFGELMDPISIHEKASNYTSLPSDDVLPEANVLDVICSRAVCSNAAKLLELQTLLLKPGGVQQLVTPENQDTVSVTLEMWRCKSSFEVLEPSHVSSLRTLIRPRQPFASFSLLLGLAC